MRHILLLSLFVILLVSSCMGPTLKEANYPGKKYIDSIELRNKTIPLPDGTWTVIASGMVDSPARHFRMVLIKDNDDKILYENIFITVDTTTIAADSGYISDTYCEMQNVHHVVVENNKVGKAQDCWILTHASTSMKLSSPIFKEAYDFFIENDYKLPTFMMRTHHRFTGKKSRGKFLEFDYFKNPAGAGFDPPKHTYWGTSEWHPLQLKHDPQKVDYIEKLKLEGATMHEKIHKGFGD